MVLVLKHSTSPSGWMSGARHTASAWLPGNAGSTRALQACSQLPAAITEAADTGSTSQVAADPQPGSCRSACPNRPPSWWATHHIHYLALSASSQAVPITAGLPCLSGNQGHPQLSHTVCCLAEVLSAPQGHLLLLARGSVATAPAAGLAHHRAAMQQVPSSRALLATQPCLATITNQLPT